MVHFQRMSCSRSYDGIHTWWLLGINTTGQLYSTLNQYYTRNVGSWHHCLVVRQHTRFNFWWHSFSFLSLRQHLHYVVYPTRLHSNINRVRVVIIINKLQTMKQIEQLASIFIMIFNSQCMHVLNKQILQFYTTFAVTSMTPTPSAPPLSMSLTPTPTPSSPGEWKKKLLSHTKLMLGQI